MSVIGHRGALYKCAENAVARFGQCVMWGLYGVELDVFLLSDQTLVVFHGYGVDDRPGAIDGYCSFLLSRQRREKRFKSVKGDANDNNSIIIIIISSSSKNNKTNILDFTYQETQQLTFTSGLEHLPCPPERWEQARSPTLEQVLSKLKGTGMIVNVELKGEGTAVPTLTLAERLDMVDQYTFSSFCHNYLKELRELRPDKTKYRTGALFGANVLDNFLQAAQDCGATENHLRYGMIPVQWNESRPFERLACPIWPILQDPWNSMNTYMNHIYQHIQNERHLYEMVLATGVDKFCCNRPDVVLAILKERAKSGGTVQMVTDSEDERRTIVG